MKKVANCTACCQRTWRKCVHTLTMHIAMLTHWAHTERNKPYSTLMSTTIGLIIYFILLYIYILFFLNPTVAFLSLYGTYECNLFFLKNKPVLNL